MKLKTAVATLAILAGTASSASAMPAAQVWEPQCAISPSYARVQEPGQAVYAMVVWTGYCAIDGTFEQMPVFNSESDALAFVRTIQAPWHQ